MAEKISELTQLNTYCSQYTQEYNDSSTKRVNDCFSQTRSSIRVTWIFSPLSLADYVNVFPWYGISMTKQMIDMLCLLDLDALYHLIKLLKYLPNSIDR